MLGTVWVHEQTFLCAMNSCVPCQYKLCPSGEGLPPNQRPEMCPRSAKTHPYHGLYQSGAILCLGDGDFSFSLSLARGLSDRSGLLASSHESHESVLSTYNKSTDILGELHSLLPGRVLHGVDATSLSSTPALEAQRGRWDLLVWNFPCVGSSAGPAADGQVQEIDRNKRLLLDFFSNARAFLSAAGEIHVTHKTFEPFSWWGIVELAEQSGLEFLGSFVFDRCLYPGYINRKVKDKKSFPLHDARTFVFAVPQPGPPSDSGKKRRPRAVDALGMRVLDAATEELLRGLRAKSNKRATSSDPATKISASKTARLHVTNE